jgi:2-C-methyl-D-erythritol 4-phosphate cytidylyltransferase
MIILLSGGLNNQLALSYFNNGSIIEYEFRDNLIFYNDDEHTFYLNIINNKLTHSNLKYSDWQKISVKDKHFILYDITSCKYISCNFDYLISITDNKKEATVFKNTYNNIENKITYEIPQLRLDFNKINKIEGYDIYKIMDLQKKNNKTIGILLCAGKGQRFGSYKQLYEKNSVPLFKYSLDKMISCCEKVYIVVNSEIITKLNDILKDYSNIEICINDKENRQDSLLKALEEIKNNEIDVDNLIIHDSCRPWVPIKYFNNINDSKKLYSQYCVEIVNGLIRNDNYFFEEVDRNDYLELCTPICSNYKLFSTIFERYIIKYKFSCEMIPILNLLNIPYDIHYGNPDLLKKITYTHDLEDVLS